MNPRLTVLMPVWNGAKHLEEAVRSILVQTESRFELLIVDDGSTDETPEVLTKLAAADPRIRVLNSPHQGIVAALNQGIAESATEWIARMDSDDIAHPERLECQLKAVEENPRAVLCHTQVEYFGDSRFVTRSARMVRSQALMRLRLCHHCSISHPTVLYRKSAVLKAGGYLPEDLHVEDFSLWGRLIETGDFVAVMRPLLKLRLHVESISKRESQVQMDLSEKIARSHCSRFLKLGERDAARACSVLRGEAGHRRFRDWIWFLRHCLPGISPKSLELRLWVLRRTITRITLALRAPRH